MRKILFILMLLFSSLNFSQSEFIKPWEDTLKPIIIDVYHSNSYKIKDVLSEKRIKGIIHKISQEDSLLYHSRRKEAIENNLLWGAYYLPQHDTDGTLQADFYLRMIGNESSNTDFLALDYEIHKKTNEIISVKNAALFVSRIYEKTGRYPYIYSGYNNLKTLLDSEYKEIFSKCSLWIVSLKKNGDISFAFTNNSIWSSYSLWQFSCEINCCKESKIPCFFKVETLECGIDYNIYNGSYLDLFNNWNK